MRALRHETIVARCWTLRECLVVGDFIKTALVACLVASANESRGKTSQTIKARLLRRWRRVHRHIHIALVEFTIKGYQLIEHHLAHIFAERTNILLSQALGLNRWEHSNTETSTLEACLAVIQAVVVLAHHRDDWELRLHCKVEGALLKRKQIGRGKVRASAFRVNKHHKIVLAHVRANRIHSFDGGRTIFAVDKDITTEPHKLTKEWHI